LNNKGFYIYRMKKPLLFITLIVLLGCSSKMAIKLPPDSIAYENIAFGIKESDYMSKYKDSSVMLDNSTYELKPLFIPSDHRMFMLHIIGESRHTKDLNTITIADMHALVDKIVSIYGNPTTYLKMADAKELDQGKVSWYCKWLINDKQITIGIARLKNDETYYRDNNNYAAVCEIKNIPLEAVASEQLIHPMY
jgi:hypothetical protein